MQIGQLQWLYASSDCTASSDTVVARATVVVFLPAEPGEARELRRRFPLMSHGGRERGPQSKRGDRAKSSQVAISHGSA
jgi:hypothetical protein